MNKIWKNMAINTLRVVSSLLFPLISFPYISRVLGPERLGTVDFAASVTNYFTLIAGLGIPTYGVIACAKVRGDAEKLKKTVAELLYINLGLNFIAYGIFFVLLFRVEKFVQNKPVLVIYSLTILFTTLGIEWLYSALEDFGYITARSIVFKTISLGLMLLVIKKPEDYLLYTCILVLSTVGSNLLNFVHARKYLKAYRLRELNIQQHIGPVLTFFSASVASTINTNTDTVMLGFFKSDYDVGLYSFSVKIKNILVSLNTAALTVIIPKLSECAAQKKYDEFRALVRKSADIVMFIACAVSVFFSTFSTEAISILGGEKYQPAHSAMIVLNVSVIVLGMTWVLGVAVLQPLGRQQDYAKTMWGATVINVALNAVLIPVLGVTGAAVATLATEMFNLMAFWWFTRDFLEKTFPVKTYLKMLLFSVAANAAVRILESKTGPTSPLSVMITAVVLFGALYCLLVFALIPEMRGMAQSLLEIVRGKMTRKNEQ